MNASYIQFRDGKVAPFLGPNARERSREFARKANAVVGPQSWARVVSVIHVKERTRWCGWRDLNPPCLSAAGPKPAVSASSTTPAAPPALPPYPVPDKVPGTVPESVPAVPVPCPGAWTPWGKVPMIPTSTHVRYRI